MKNLIKFLLLLVIISDSSIFASERIKTKLQFDKKAEYDTSAVRTVFNNIEGMLREKNYFGFEFIEFSLVYGKESPESFTITTLDSTFGLHVNYFFEQFVLTDQGVS